MPILPKRYFETATTEDFIKQAREFEGFDQDVLDRVAKLLLSHTHPWTVMRAAELHRWHDAGDYESVFIRQAPRPPLPAAFCVSCGARLADDDRFCMECGAPIN